MLLSFSEFEKMEGKWMENQKKTGGRTVEKVKFLWKSVFW